MHCTIRTASMSYRPLRELRRYIKQLNLKLYEFNQNFTKKYQKCFISFQSQELVPTSIRSSVLGGLFAVNRLGYITGSQLLKLKFVTSSWVSLLIFGILALLGALTATSLQDTTRGGK